MKKIFLLLLAISFTSCATLFSEKEYNVRVISYEKNRKAAINDSIYTLPADVMVKRSKEDLKVTLIGDTLRKDFTVKASLRPAFLYGNLAFLIGAPVGYAVDLNNQKRFYYGKRIILNASDSVTVIEHGSGKRWKNYFNKQYSLPKGQWAFTASIPYVNNFYQQPKNEPSKNNSGFFGLSLGLEYYYKDNRFVKLSVASPIDFDLPIIAPLDKFDAYETTRATAFTITNNRKFNRLEFGYGLSYAIHTWRMINSDWEFPSNEERPRTKNSQSFGLTANVYYQVLDNVSLGVVYTPTLYNVFPESRFSYQHIISFDILYRLPFKF